MTNCEGFKMEWPRYEPEPKPPLLLDLDEWSVMGTKLGIGCRPKPTTFNYKKVIFNDPATIVFWEDGTKTVVKCAKGEVFDPVKGLAIAFMKHALGDGNKHNKIIHKETANYITIGQSVKKVLDRATEALENYVLYGNSHKNALGIESESYATQGNRINDSDPM